MKMTPLQEKPELFANGQFKVDIKGFTNLTIEQYDAINNMFWTSAISNAISVGECTLIARPISDMSPAEHARAEDFREENELKAGFNLGLYMLSIGVYPFDQNHFKDGTVIDGTKEEHLKEG